MQKNVGSQKLIVFAFDATTNLPKTGDAGNITAYVSKDFGAVTVLGDTTATEMDATNAKGYYLFDLTAGETNGDTLMFSGKSATANIVVVAVPAVVFTTPPNFSLESIDGSGRVDVIKINGTSQTARDLGASVLVSVGAGAGQINVSGGKVPATLAAADVTGNVTADVQTIKTQTVTCGAGVTVGAFVGNATAALGVDASGRVTVITYVGDTPQTGDAFARIGATGSGLTSLAPASTALSTAQWTNGRAANLDNLDAAISTRSTYAGGAVASVTGNVGGSVASVTAAVTVGTNNDKTGYALTSGERDAVADAHLDRASGIETGVTPRQVQRGIAAALAGQNTGAGTGTEVFKAANNAGTTRTTYVIDAAGNRTSVTLNW